MHAFVVGTSISPPQPLPSQWRNIANLPALSPADLAQLGWLPVVVSKPPLGRFERYGAPARRVMGDTVEEVWPVAAMSREERELLVLRDIETLSAEKLSRFAYDFGAPHGVLHLQLRDESDRLNWLTLQGTCTSLILAGAGTTQLALRTEENITLALPAATIANVLMAMAQYGASVLATAWQHKDAVRAAPSPETIDITPGWPQ